MIDLVLDSLKDKEGNVNSTNEIISWIKDLNASTKVEISEVSINNDSFWFYDDYKGEILNRKRSFFSIVGIRYFVDGAFKTEQPIIIQNEIGYLGIIAKVIDGRLNFLMQAKIEPGNVNVVQLSPTIQATKSNFTRAHGGRLPYYFEYFENPNNHQIIYDQIQSEQGDRFLGKRNRNIILLINEDIDLHPNYKWMTLGQIKELLKIDNLVNMDTRTVLSGLPLAHNFKDEKVQQNIVDAYHRLNNFKMYHDVDKQIVPLHQLVDWEVDPYGVSCKKSSEFCVRHYQIHIDGREVSEWMQPLFKASKQWIFGLITRFSSSESANSIKKNLEFLVKLKPEIGCFDKVEFGPSVQLHQIEITPPPLDKIEACFNNYINNKKGILYDVVLSEEGGRFYHEQNRNIIILIDNDSLQTIPQNYLWVSYTALYQLIQSNNVVNIQLRNLISLLDKSELLC